MMKSFVKKLAAGATACLCLVSALSGCYSEDKAWSAKRGDDTAPIGVYIYYLSSAYSEALGKVEDTTKSVFDQKIDDKDGTQWVKDRAVESIKLMYYVDQKFEDMGLELTTEDQTQISNLTSSVWSYSSAMFDQYGIAEKSVDKAYSQFIVKYQKIFETLYGKGGEKEVTDEDLRKYYEEKYTDFDYILCSYTKKTDDGQSEAMTDDEKAEAKKDFDAYVTKIKDGDLTMEEAAEEYQKKIDSDSEQLKNQTVDLDEASSYYPKDLITKLGELKDGEVAAVDLADSNSYYIVRKNSISKKCDEILKDDDSRMSVVSGMKSEEYSNTMEEESKKLDDITFNDGAMAGYDPKMFFDESHLSSASSSSTSSTSE